MPELIAKTTGGDYQILIRKGALQKTGQISAEVCKGRRVCIVSDENVWPLYGETVSKSLADAGFKVSQAIIPPGETSKSYTRLLSLYEKFNEAGINRADLIIALGGGVVGDLTGFAAASWLRGVPLVQVPTTLLAQVDSSIGGKTAIDLPFGKNLAGAFYQPRAVIMDPSVLMTLPRAYTADGMAEVIKYGLIRDRSLFEQIESKTYDLEWLLERCVRTKITVVSNDERDTGERMLLNFGHTVGHAIEKVTNYERYSHGEAVSIGMVIAARIGEKLGETAAGTTDRIIRILKSYNLPVETDLSVNEVLPVIAADKKNMGSRLYFVLIRDIGDAYLKPLKRSELAELLQEVWQHV